VNVQFPKNHRLIPIEGATYYLHPTSRGKRTPIRIGKDVAVAHTAMINMDYGRSLEGCAELEAHPPSVVASRVLRKTAFTRPLPASPCSFHTRRRILASHNRDRLDPLRAQGYSHQGQYDAAEQQMLDGSGVVAGPGPSTNPLKAGSDVDRQ
jgi:hypothetical protein